jgi:8-oxo-dGTP pyrophosphatase MutT (NUDIX family)
MSTPGRPSTRPTINYPSTHFLESSGAIPFILSKRQIVLITRTLHDSTGHAETEYILAKGRRNINESRLTNALHEVREETGYTCLPLPVTLDTRLCPAEEIPGVFTEDMVRVYENAVEPFMMNIRELWPGDVKVIWFFLAAVDENVPVETVNDSEVSGVQAFGYEEAVARCTFEGDREVLRRAIALVEGKGRERRKLSG